VHQQINSFRIEPTAICFEVTETAGHPQPRRKRTFPQEPEEHRLPFALDDFGSGLCSFAYLKSLPVDFLKNRRAFVRNLSTAPSTAQVD